MTKRKAESETPSAVKRTAFSWTDNADIPDAALAMKKLFESWHQCFQDQQTASTPNELAAIVECSSNAIDFIRTKVLATFLEFRSNAYDKQQQHYKAEKDMNEIIKLAPQSLTTYLRLGSIRMEQGCFEEALALYKQGLRMMPKHTPDSNILQNCIDTMETSVEATVNTHINQCKLSKAAHAAENWIQMYPKSIQAYFTTGKLYLDQGNPQYALRVFDRAEPHVKHDGDPSLLQQLKSYKAIASIQLQKRVDFIALVPFDIVSPILSHLPFFTLLECMAVSKTWYHRIDQCHTAWQSLKIGEAVRDDYLEMGDDYLEMADYDVGLYAAQRRSDNIRNLWLGPDLCRTRHLRTWVIACTQFDNLETLVLRSVNMYCLDLGLLLNSLRMIGSTLTKFEFSCVGSTYQHNSSLSPFVQLWKVLGPFQRLTHFLYMDTAYKLMDQDETLPVIPTLTHLFLSSSSLQVPSTDVDGILMACPNLCFLNTNASLGFLDVIQYRLQQLRCISMNVKERRVSDDGFFPDDDDGDYYEGEPPAGPWDELFDKNYSPANGIRTISITAKFERNAVALYTLLDGCRNTLEELTLQERPETSWDDDEGEHFQDEFDEYYGQRAVIELRRHWNIFSEFNSNQLKIFNCGIDCLQEATLMSIIRQCPALESISFHKNTQITNEIFDVLTALARLDSLSITECDQITSTGLASFLDTAAARQYTLRKFQLEIPDALTDNFFDSLAKVQSISTLELAGSCKHSSALAKAIEELTGLETFVLCRMKGINFPSIAQKLSGLSRLANVKFESMGALEGDVIIDLARKSCSIETVTIKNCHVHGGFPFVHPYNIRVVNTPDKNDYY